MRMQEDILQTVLKDSNFHLSLFDAGEIESCTGVLTKRRER